MTNDPFNPRAWMIQNFIDHLPLPDFTHNQLDTMKFLDYVYDHIHQRGYPLSQSQPTNAQDSPTLASKAPDGEILPPAPQTPQNRR